MSFEHLKPAARSDVGRRRKTNEDSVVSIPRAGVFCVADGMGGAALGEVASRWAVEELAGAFQKPVPPDQRIPAIRQAINNASERIHGLSEERGAAGMGTTVIIIVFDPQYPDRAAVLHAGDSRAYRLRDGKLECLMIEHSMAAAAGVKHEKALPAMFRGVVTRAVGLKPTVDLDETPVTVAGGDLYLLCSDGLTKMLPDKKITKLLNRMPDAAPEELADMLIREANEAGGEDNVSVIAVAVADPLPPPSSDDSDSLTSETAAGLPPLTADSHDFAGAADQHSSDSGDLPLLGMTPTSGHIQAVTADGNNSTPSAAIQGHTPETPPTGNAPDGAAMPETQAARPPETHGLGERIRKLFGHGGTAGIVAIAAGIGLLAAIGIVLRQEGSQPAQADADAPIVEEPHSIPFAEAPKRAPEPPAEPPRTTEETSPPPRPAQPEPPAATEPVTPAPPLEGLAPEPAAFTPPPPEAETLMTVDADAPAAVEPTTAADTKMDEPEPTPASAPEPATPATPRPPNPESLVQAHAADIQRSMQQALTSGRWNDFILDIEPLVPHKALLIQRVPGVANALVWVEEWRKAEDSMDYARRNLQRYSDLVATVLAATGTAEIPGGAAAIPDDAPQPADVYCRELYRLRQALVTHVDRMMKQLRRESACLGSNPARTLKDLQRFTMEGDRIAPVPYDEFTRQTGLLNTWLEQELAADVPLMGIMNGPPQLVPAVMQARRELWINLAEHVDAVKNGVASWSRRNRRSPLCLSANALREEILRSCRTSDLNTLSGWPTQDTLDQMQTLLTTIGRIVDSTPPDRH